MKDFISKISDDFGVEIMLSDSNEKGVNSYRVDENGHVTHLHLYQLPVSTLVKLFPIADTLISLTLSDCDISNIEALSNFSQLRELDLTLNSISDLRGLEVLGGLKRLGLSCVYMDSVEELGYLENLEVLDISSNIDLSLKNELEGLKRLRELDLEGNDIFDIRTIGRSKSITKLNLKECRLLDMNGLHNFPHLQYLNLSGNPIEKIDGLSKMTSLRSIYLNSTSISKIEGLDSLENLEALDLSDTKITKIQGLENLINLRDLNLSYLKVNKIEGLETLVFLELLMLINNDISEIQNLPYNKLETLLFSGNKVKEIDYDWLKKIKQPCVINLANNPIEIKIDCIPNHITIELEDCGMPLTM